MGSELISKLMIHDFFRERHVRRIRRMFGVSAANPEAALSVIRSVIEVHK